MKEIPLSQDRVALVDDADFEWLNQWQWGYQRRSDTTRTYALRRVGHLKSQRTIYMHRMILGLRHGDGVVSDHVNGNGLDNQRHNLRRCTHAQNLWNQRPQTRPKTSRYKGVHWYRNYQKWRAQIRHNGKCIHLGYFASEDVAAHEYNLAAQRLFGEFALLNVIDEI